jgi:hypothetical protein
LINKGERLGNLTPFTGQITKKINGDLPNIFLLVALCDVDVCTTRLQIHLLHLQIERRGGKGQRSKVFLVQPPH